MSRLARSLVAAGAAWTLIVSAAPLLGISAVYTAAHLVCHQIPERSFHLGGGALAVCARCLGLYVGAVAGGTAALAARARSTDRARACVLLAAIPTVMTVAAEWLLRWPVGNAMRFAMALPLGFAAAWVVAVALEVDWRT